MQGIPKNSEEHVLGPHLINSTAPGLPRRGLPKSPQYCGRVVLQQTRSEPGQADVLAHLSFPKAHRLQIHSTNPLERLNAEIKRRTDVVGIFPNEAAIVRLVGALLLEQNDERQLQRRYLQLEGLQALGDNQPARLSAVMS